MAIAIHVHFDVSAARKVRGWSQERLAEICSISVRTVRRAEAGHRIAVSNVAALQEALKASISVERPAIRSLMIGSRVIENEGSRFIEELVVERTHMGWLVLCVYESDAQWAMNADGLMRKIGDPKTIPFATQSEAILAAVWNLEFWRRTNHPSLVARRREALARTGKLPAFDNRHDNTIWSAMYEPTPPRMATAR